jgi:hypothetical protein
MNKTIFLCLLVLAGMAYAESGNKPALSERPCIFGCDAKSPEPGVPSAMSEGAVSSAEQEMGGAGDAGLGGFATDGAPTEAGNQAGAAFGDELDWLNTGNYFLAPHTDSNSLKQFDPSRSGLFQNPFLSGDEASFDPYTAGTRSSTEEDPLSQTALERQAIRSDESSVFLKEYENLNGGFWEKQEIGERNNPSLN